KEFSASTISRFSAQLDTELEAWRSRPLEGTYPYVLLDARWEKCRRDGAIVDMAVLVAIGVSEDGSREVLALETGWGESESVWSSFTSGLKERGRLGVCMCTSVAQPGLQAAFRSHYSGIAWQRCQLHFLRTDIDN